MPATDPRVSIGDRDPDGLTADVRASDPAADTAGVVVRIAGTLGSAPPSGSATYAAQTDGSQRTGIHGANGSSIASVANPVPVGPGTGTVWDIADRAARLVGVVTAAAGAGLALETGGNLATLVTKLAGGLPAAIGLSPGLKTEEQLAPAAEDNTNAVIAVSQRPFTGLTFTNGTPSVGIVYNNRGASVTDTIRAGVAKMLSFTCHNKNAAVRYVQFHNKATVAVNPDVPQLSLAIAAGDTLVIGAAVLTQYGEPFSTGFTFAFSTTEDTYTAGAAGDHSTQVRYI